jgi:chemotaxis protein CheD
LADETITIGIGAYVVTGKPCILETLGLGSCVGICIWDRSTKIGGLAHIMLDKANGREKNPNRFADKAVPAMIESMIAKGAKTTFMVAKIFGGASLFETDTFNIGEENVKKVKEILEQRKIPLVASDVGGNHGRSVWFDVKTGSVVVGSVFGPTQEY